MRNTPEKKHWSFVLNKVKVHGVMDFLTLVKVFITSDVSKGVQHLFCFLFRTRIFFWKKQKILENTKITFYFIFLFFLNIFFLYFYFLY